MWWCAPPGVCIRSCCVPAGLHQTAGSRQNCVAKLGSSLLYRPSADAKIVLTIKIDGFTWPYPLNIVNDRGRKAHR
jgi:hypothetical protein